MKKLLLGALVSVVIVDGFSQTPVSPDTLFNRFSSPPSAAKPRVWWHWMNGNITQDGVSKDLQWMHRVGIGGFQNFDAAMATPQIVPQRLSYMTPEWKRVFRYTTKLADSLGLEMAIAGSPGWSESGGPWVKPEDGMKKVVWSETLINGVSGGPITLAKPPSTTGPFQNIPHKDELSMGEPAAEPPVFYKDIAVIAYKRPEGDIPLSELKPEVTSSGGQFTLSQLTDGDLATTNLLPSDTAKGFAWIRFAFAQPQTIKAITVVGGGDRGPFGLFGDLKDTRSLEASDDGEQFHQLCLIPAGFLVQQTIAVPITTARFFRITFKNPPPRFDFGAMLGAPSGPPKPPPGTDIAEVVLHTATRINMFEEKDGFATATNLYAEATPSTKDVIARADVTDITDKMSGDGTLNWTPAAGKWTVVRFGYSLTGITNHPASKEATGPEVDKLDAAAVKAYFTTYLNQYKDATGGLMGTKGGLQFMVTDSWEAGMENWTGSLPAEFAKRRGYSLVTWLPVLTGHVIESADASEHFLWDFRKTLGELVAENHYDQLTTLLQQYGMKRYSESHESGRALIVDGMDVKRTAAVPMSAMWTPGIINHGDMTIHKADIRESASVAHIYGQNLVAAESLTAFGLGGAAWSYSPENLKPTADLELASGLNRFVIHTSVHQPTDDKIPGLGLGPFGQWFNRHETWAEQAKAWTAYLSRSCYLLQQGKFVADIVYFYGEDNNITNLFSKNLPNLPDGYNYDFINADALLHRLSVKDGRLFTPSGMQYRLLALDSNSRQMTLPIARQIRALVRAGAIVCGPRPQASPSLKDDPAEFNSIVNELWGGGETTKLGLGTVHAGRSVAEVLQSLNIAPDFSYDVSGDSAQLLFVHRSTPGKEIYWVNNRKNNAENLEAMFRTTGRAVEIWHPETGRKEPASYHFDGSGTKVSLHLTPNDAVFVMFGERTTKASVNIPEPATTVLTKLDGQWAVQFQKDRGAPAGTTMDQLASWTDNPDTGIKYFSGTATYTKTVTAEQSWLGKGKQVWLDLGEVKNLAELIVNGKSMGIVWKQPFRVDIGSALKAGPNMIVVKVTNLWVNRLIGDQQPNVEKKISYTTMPFYQANSPLLPSGLLGPVILVGASH